MLYQALIRYVPFVAVHVLQIEQCPSAPSPFSTLPTLPPYVGPRCPS